MKILERPTAAACGDVITNRLKSALASGKPVLWFLTGGSNIAVEVQVMADLSPSSTENLTLALTDERFGPVGHPDSNWQQLSEAGFEPQQATCIPILNGSADMAATVQTYQTTLETVLDAHETIIGFFGMGDDGHIAGILPHSPAVSAKGMVVGYHTETYDRITSTFETIKRCEVAYVFAFGDSKRQTLVDLQHDRTLAEQPAQIIKQLPEAYVYNDQIGDIV